MITPSFTYHLQSFWTMIWMINDASWSCKVENLPKIINRSLSTYLRLNPPVLLSEPLVLIRALAKYDLEPLLFGSNTTSADEKRHRVSELFFNMETSLFSKFLSVSISLRLCLERSRKIHWENSQKRLENQAVYELDSFTGGKRYNYVLRIWFRCGEGLQVYGKV